MRVVIAMPRMSTDPEPTVAQSKYIESLARAGAGMRWVELSDPEQAVQDALTCDGLLLPGGLRASCALSVFVYGGLKQRLTAAQKAANNKPAKRFLFCAGWVDNCVLVCRRIERYIICVYAAQSFLSHTLRNFFTGLICCAFYPTHDGGIVPLFKRVTKLLWELLYAA